jgi:hypothetical protein
LKVMAGSNRFSRNSTILRKSLLVGGLMACKHTPGFSQSLPPTSTSSEQQFNS